MTSAKPDVDAVPGMNTGHFLIEFEPPPCVTDFTVTIMPNEAEPSAQPEVTEDISNSQLRKDDA